MNAMTQGKVVVAGVSKTFGTRGNSEGTQALRPIDMALRDGEFVSIVGPSGCGKSTLFNIIAGLIPPSTGHVYMDGRDVTGKTGLVGYMLQKDLLLPWKSVLENVTLGLELQGDANGRGAGTRTGTLATLWPGRVRAPLSPRTVRRHAPACGIDAHAALCARRLAAGRAIWRAGRPNALLDATVAARRVAR